jgi:hypothetical protein
MRKATFPPKIKEPMGWIAAGDGFRRASRLLSDGAFKLFAHLALEADCRTGCVQATYKTLAADLKKSKRAIGTYSTELNDKGVCKVRPGENQYCKTAFEICDSYWPYERETHPEACELESYVTAIQEIFLALGCTTGKFGAGDMRTAKDFEKRGVPLEVVEDAMLLGACRKYSSWLEGRKSEPIGSLLYFGTLVDKIQRQPLPPGYREYLRGKITKFARTCSQEPRSGNGRAEGRRSEKQLTEDPTGQGA